MRYQIRCVCGHLSAFEIIPMPVVPGHRDMKISDEPPNITAKLERVARAAKNVHYAGHVSMGGLNDSVALSPMRAERWEEFQAALADLGALGG